MLSEHIDAGEAEAIALAKELKADLLLIDEKLGKQFAEAENLKCKGVIGIEAKRYGYIELIKPFLDDLVQNLKFRLSSRIYELALERAGER
jgi:predicted nucleic acid-binding protein